MAVHPRFVCSKIIATLYDGDLGEAIPADDDCFIRRRREAEDELQSAGLSRAELGQRRRRQSNRVVLSHICLPTEPFHRMSALGH